MKLRALGLLILLVVAVPTPARADEPDASRPPRTSGPLIGPPVWCEDDGEPPRNGASIQACAAFFHLAPVDTNVQEDFSAYWVQMEIELSEGWCAIELTFAWRDLEDARIISSVPDRGRRIRQGNLEVTSLEVDGDGAAVVPGVIEQNTIIPSGRITVKGDESNYSFRWRGMEENKVVIAIGLQLAHAPLPKLSYSVRERARAAGWVRALLW